MSNRPAVAEAYKGALQEMLDEGLGKAKRADATGAVTSAAQPYTMDPRCPVLKTDPIPTTFDASKTYAVNNLVSWFSPVGNDTDIYKLVTEAPAGTLPSDPAWKAACSYGLLSGKEKEDWGAKMRAAEEKAARTMKSMASTRSGTNGAPKGIQSKIDGLKATKGQLTAQASSIATQITSIDSRITKLQAAADAQAAAIAKAAANAQAAANAANVGGRRMTRARKSNRKTARKTKRKGKTHR